MQERLCVPPLRLDLEWRSGMLHRFQLGWVLPGDEDWFSSPSARAVKVCLQQYLDTGQASWPELPLAWQRLPSFSQLILRALQADVSSGMWIAYSDLAARCGKPRAARAVGAAMRANPWPLIVPCHRVLAKGKGLGGFSGGLDIKRFLLSLEGILE